MEKSHPPRFTGREVHALLQRARIASLATLDPSGTPYVSLVNLGSDAIGQPVILISRLAWHTRNLEADPRGSVMAAEPTAVGDALTGPRVTVMGRFEKIKDDLVRQSYLAKHPEALVYVDFSDFSFWRLAAESVHAVAGFGRIETLRADDIFF